jgi:hypothetical protein
MTKHMTYILSRRGIPSQIFNFEGASVMRTGERKPGALVRADDRTESGLTTTTGNLR